MNERDGITINSGRLPCLRAGFTVQFRRKRGRPTSVWGETLCGFGSRRPHQWNDGAICEAANLAAIDDLGPPNRSIRSAQFGEGQRSATAKGKAKQD